MSKEQQAVELRQAALTKTLSSVAELESYFTSGNEILIDRAWIPRAVWDAVKSAINEQLQEAELVLKTLRSTLKNWEMADRIRYEQDSIPLTRRTVMTLINTLNEAISTIGPSSSEMDLAEKLGKCHTFLVASVNGTTTPELKQDKLFEVAPDRQAFEKWYCDGPRAKTLFATSRHGDYRDNSVALAWRAWQKSAKHHVTSGREAEGRELPYMATGEFLSDLDQLVCSALLAAKYFIINGTALGYIRMPDHPDPAHGTLPMIENALRLKVAGQHDEQDSSPEGESPDQCVKANWQQFNKLALSPGHPLLQEVRAIMQKHGFQSREMADEIITATQQHLVSKAVSEAVRIDWKRETNNALAEFDAIGAVYDSTRGTYPGPKMAAAMRKVELMLTGWFSWHREHLRAALIPARVKLLQAHANGIQEWFSSEHARSASKEKLASYELRYMALMNEIYQLEAIQHE